VVGNSHKPELPQIIENLSPASPRADFVPAASLQHGSVSDFHTSAKILTGAFKRQPLFGAPVFGEEGNHTRPTLKIQDGCNSRCSYCVIPFVRGNSRSLPPETVVHEINRLTASGVREIVLSGINLGTYGRDLSPRIAFGDLLRRILDETPVERLRISSIEPMDVTSDLIGFFANNDRLAQHFHMPLQSGNDRILAAMNRWYRADHYARRLQLIRERLPDAAIGADVIAGFPGETQEEHSSTVAFIENLPFTYLHVFSFSKRPGTAAAGFSGEIPANVIKNRARELRALGESKSSAFRREQVGKQLRVLTLRSAGDDDALPENLPTVATHEPRYAPALSSNYLRVRLSGTWPANQWVNARISDGEGNYVLGEPEESVNCSATAYACS
jgi:threonylcarbamoyladenosine tRNA methylthiotransferase MtaB